MSNNDQSPAPALRRQITQFCIYGFLKNLQFFEPFLILAFRDKGFSFAAIGLLISFRAVCVNVLEVPSGAIADIWGKRRAMILSMLSYIASFIFFALATEYLMFFPAMLCFSLGEAFRTGTHKAMIFNWVNQHGIQDQKTRIYGLTRSWSKQGSSLNCIAAAAIIIFFKKYEWVFLLTIIPYALNIINLSMYPSYLDDSHGRPRSFKASADILVTGIKLAFTRRALSCLILENICFEGIFSVVKDYLQPLLKALALSAPILLAASGKTRTAILVAAVYFVLHQASSAASRTSHRAVALAGSEQDLGRRLWITAAILYLAMLGAFYFGMQAVAVVAFILLAVILNIWKPVFVSRFHDQSEQDSAATTLSIANQSKTLVIAVAAPALGWAIDRASTMAPKGISISFWPVAMLGLAAAIAGLLINRVAREPETG